MIQRQSDDRWHRWCRDDDDMVVHLQIVRTWLRDRCALWIRRLAIWRRSLTRSLLASQSLIMILWHFGRSQTQTFEHAGDFDAMGFHCSVFLGGSAMSEWVSSFLTAHQHIIGFGGRPPILGASPRTWAIGAPVGSYETTSTIAII